MRKVQKRLGIFCETAWQKVQIARANNRKTSLDYIEKIFDEFIGGRYND